MVPRLTLATPEEKELYEIGKGVQYGPYSPLFRFLRTLGESGKWNLERC
jgi:hypothetical protein